MFRKVKWYHTCNCTCDHKCFCVTGSCQIENVNIATYNVHCTFVQLVAIPVLLFLHIKHHWLFTCTNAYMYVYMYRMHEEPSVWSHIKFYYLNVYKCLMLSQFNQSGLIMNIIYLLLNFNQCYDWQSSHLHVKQTLFS